MTPKHDETDAHASQRTTAYEAPSVRVMDEKEILKVFQITSAATSWWH